MGPWSHGVGAWRSPMHGSPRARRAPRSFRRFGLRRLLRLLGLLVRDPGVAVDARRLAGGELLVLLLRVLGLFRARHRRRVVARAAVLRVVAAHLVPDLVGEPPALALELLARRDRAAQLAPGVAHAGLRLVD